MHLSLDKNEILREFSSDPDRYYKVKLFDEEGFVRKSCLKCKRYFWTLDTGRDHCPDHSDDTYSFIGNPPTNKRFDYIQSWEEVESFFKENGHTSVNRYPVVCRWRDDLYFTIASIVDFQRILGSKVVFEFPANPLVVPQVCLRFKDLENVGVTGRHFSSFCMIGQHCVPTGNGYWKDECVDLDYKLLTKPFGIIKEKVVFVEDVWEGGGSFGPSLEYFVNGLELGNAVFTEFQGELGKHTELDQKIIDMGAGLERFAWITMGTPTAYDCTFGPVTNQLISKTGIEMDSSLVSKYFTAIARNIENYDDIFEARKQAIIDANLSEDQVNRIISPLEGIYLISDHIRTLIFAISDGALPSNVSGGYNLRIVLRRIIGTMQRLGLKVDLYDLVDSQIDYLKKTYPELEGTRNDVKEILRIEASRYEDSKYRMEKIAQKIKAQKEPPTVDELITLYESDGITPDYLKELNVISEIPSTFYSKLSDLHQSVTKQNTSNLPLDGLPETEALFYKEDPKEFEAKVLRVFDNSVVLDKSSFYARGGGQEPDYGTIAGYKVVDVNKHGNIIVHQLKDGVPNEGQVVRCEVDAGRRENITKHHTSTHILNSSSRNILGSWVWQNSAFKENDYARLDITHHSNLTEEEIQKIEDLANSVIQKNLPVEIEEYDRGRAEQKYGFRIYQGGVVPVKSVRIVKVSDFDIEACGGTHVKHTGEIGLVKITKTERIQDGVVRIEFVSGYPALKFIQSQDKSLTTIARSLEADKQKIIESFKRNFSESENVKRKLRTIIRRTNNSVAKNIIDNAKLLEGLKFYSEIDDELDVEFHIAVGEEAIKQEPSLIYCALVVKDKSIQIIVYVGKTASEKIGASELVKEVSRVLGGSGGGNNRFAQGGGKETAKLDEAIRKAELLISG